MKQIIVLGGGFAGTAAVLRLKKIFKNKEISITLIDRNSYHLFTPSLYEVATSEEPKKNIAIPLHEIFPDRISIVKSNIKNIDTKSRYVTVSDDIKYNYDQLIIALGSEPAYYDIEGLRQYGVALKTLESSVKIREKIKEIYHEKVQDGKVMKIIIGGGGFTGTELAAELTEYRKKLSAHHKKPAENLKITVIQGPESLLKELDVKVSKIAKERLERENIELCFGFHIKKVEKNILETDNGRKHDFDILIWTGGVRASSVILESGFKVNGKGQVSIDDKMLIFGFKNVFAVGDIAEFADPYTNKPAPGVARIAIEEGKIAGENAARSVLGKELISYKYRHWGYIIPIKGKFAVCELIWFRIVGFWGWVLQQLVFLHYLLEILSVSKALRRWNKFEMYLMNHSN